MSLAPRVATLLIACTGAAHAQALLDASFGNNGTTFVFFDQPTTTLSDDHVAVLPAPNDDILVVGAVDIADPSPSVVGIGLARMRPDGAALDPAFGTQGRVVTNAAMTSVTDATTSVLDEILVVGGIGNDSALVRYRPNGTLDTTLAGDGGAIFDASGINARDQPTVVADVGGSVYVAGSFTNNFDDQVNGEDAFLGRVHPTSGAFTAMRRIDMGSAADHAVDIDAMLTPALTHYPVWLADNFNDDFAGRVETFHFGTYELTQTIALQGLLTAAAGCQTTFRDARSTDLVPLSAAFAAVVGTLHSQTGVALQPYVIVLDLANGSVASAQCGPENDDPDALIRISAGAAEASLFGVPALHLSIETTGSSNPRTGYWRWVPTGPLSAPRYLPDVAFNDGKPVLPDFDRPSNNSGIALDAQGRALIGATQFTGGSDRDIAVARVHTTLRVFRDGFGN